MKEVFKKLQTLRDLGKPSSPKVLIVEGPVNCNRNCSYCKVPKRWNKEKASTVDQTCEQINWGFDEGFRVLLYVGGETLAKCPRKNDIISEKHHMCPHGVKVYDSIVRQKEEPFRTKEGITFEENTKRIIKHAHKKGFVTNVTTNGDFVDYPTIAGLKESGLDSLSFSVHSPNENSLARIISSARMAAKERIVPIVTVVFTKDRAEAIPKIAEMCAANGILFSTALVQERGGGFSTVPKDPKESQIPTPEQQKVVFDRLKKLKKKGYIRANLKYLNNAPNFPDNSWKCNPDTNAFAHIRATGNGKVGVCAEAPLRFNVNKVHLKDEKWKETKKDFVDKCPGCLYGCNYESENQDLKGDLRTFLNMLLIKTGQAGLVRFMGQRSLGKKVSEVKPIPQSEQEKFQKEYKKEFKSIYSKAKRTVSYAVDFSINSTILTLFVVVGLIKGRSPKKSFKAYTIWRILPGL